jgi:Domain of unknown function (DUF6438)
LGVALNLRGLALVALAMARFPLSGQQPQADHPRVSDEEVTLHRLGARRAIRIPRPPSGFVSIQVEVIVDAGGNVTSAKPVRGPEGLFEQAATLVKTLKYRPFERNGKPAAAAFTEYVNVFPPEEYAETHVPFPEVHDWGTVSFTLERTMCFGRCPVYKVEIRGDGTVLYEGSRFVAVEGSRQDRISREDVRRLLELARAADYFSLLPAYRAHITDLPSCITSLSIDGKTMTVVDYAGESVGMPQGVGELEAAIDRMANTARWVKGARRSEP